MFDTPDDDGIVCQTHGRRPNAFVCQHLLDGSGLGFNFAPDPANLLCPTAWCDHCDAALQDAGEWDEQVMGRAAPKRVCDQCYDLIRGRNWLEPPGELERLLRRAVDVMQEKQTRAQQAFRLGSYERYDWDQDTGQLIFSSGGKPKVIADAVFTGSTGTRSGTWLWSWANESIVKGAKARMDEVRLYGCERRLLKLAAARWKASEQDGQQMNVISAYLLKALGCYRAPAENGCTFMVMTGLRWVP